MSSRVRPCFHALFKNPMMATIFATQPGVNLCYQHTRAVSKPKGRRAHVRKGKVTARKVSDILNSIARLVRAVGVLVDAPSKWIG